VAGAVKILAQRRSRTAQRLYSKKHQCFPAESEDTMANEQVNYKAVLADLEAKKAQIESAIAAIKMIAAQGGNLSGSAVPATVEPGVFLKMSIPDAAKKLLEIRRQKQSTQAVIDALEAGGLPKSKYTTVWGILSRRAKKVGDLINMQGDWALAEWYPNYRKPESAKKEHKKIAAPKAAKKEAKAKEAKPKVANAKATAPIQVGPSTLAASA
jgi:hypothetical protein